MSDRPTPETDAEVDAEMLCACYPNEYVDAEFARKLERERDEALEELSLKQQTLTIAEGTLFDLRKQRDDCNAIK